MVGINVDLLEMYRVWLDELDVRKADRSVVGPGDPQMSLSLSSLQNVRARSLAQDGLGRVSREKPGGCQLNRCQPLEILHAGCRDRVRWRHSILAY